jgi:RimJ/RimL family protein N-acetyltransferase
MMQESNQIPKPEHFVIPIIRTERLILRAFRPEDLDPFAAMVSDPEVIGLATYQGKVMTRAQAWNWLCLMLGHWHMRGFGIWAVEEAESGELIGRIGLQFLDWFDDVELVWMLRQSSWGKGFASEGAKAAIQYGFDEKDLPRIAAVINIDNQSSIRLAERVGMIREKELEREGVQFIQYAIDQNS